MKIAFFTRARTAGQYSLERVLDNLIAGLGDRVETSVCHVRPGVRGLLDAPAAVAAQGDVNHIAGHVHLIASVLGRQTVLTVHDLGYLRNATAVRKAVYRVLWYELPLKRVAAIVAVSEYTRRELLREFGLEERSVVVIHDCVPPDMEPSPREFHGECPTILVVGTAPHKNVGRLIEAATGMRCQLLVVGSLEERLRETLKARKIAYEERSNVTDVELTECYQRSDVVYFASTHEGFGLPIVEAQAIGRPVITSKVCSMPEVAGDGALFVDPYDVVAIRRALEDLFMVASLRIELVARGFENVKRFNRADFVDAHMEVYDRVSA